MEKVTDILTSLNKTRSLKEKEAILRLHQSNTVLKKVFSVAYSKELNFFVRNFKVSTLNLGLTPLEESIDMLVKNIAGRVYTGDDAKSYLSQLVQTCEDPGTLLKVINRDLECGIQTTLTNKVWKDLVTEPPYQSYTLFKEVLLRKFNYKGAFSDEKMDGLYTDIMVWPEQVVYRSRSGKELNFRAPSEVESRLMQAAAKTGSFVAHGEGLVIDKSGLHGVMDRAEGNGYLNQEPSSIERDRVRLVVWDMVAMEEYIARKSKTHYRDRRSGALELVEMVGCHNHFRMVDGHQINSLRDAIDHFKEMRGQKKEGTVLKEAGMPWGDNKTKKGIKIKNEFDVWILRWLVQPLTRKILL